jgi:hypothetical protein
MRQHNHCIYNSVPDLYSILKSSQHASVSLCTNTLNPVRQEASKNCIESIYSPIIDFVPPVFTPADAHPSTTRKKCLAKLKQQRINSCRQPANVLKLPRALHSQADRSQKALAQANLRHPLSNCAPPPASRLVCPQCIYSNNLGHLPSTMLLSDATAHPFCHAAILVLYIIMAALTHWELPR